MIIGCIVLSCVFLVSSLFLLIFLTRKQKKRKIQIDEMLNNNSNKLQKNNKYNRKEKKSEPCKLENRKTNLANNTVFVQKKSNFSSDEKHFKSGFILAGHFITAFAIIGFIILLILGIDIIIVLILFFSDIFIICLTYGLGNALTKVYRLEAVLYDKKIIDAKDKKVIDAEEENANITIEKELEFDFQTEGCTYCNKCGYQLFPEDKVCPNCKNSKET